MNQDITALAAEAFQIRERNFQPVMQFDRLDATLAVTVTGSSCAVDCAHCGGQYLKSMTPIHRLVKSAEFPEPAALLAPHPLNGSNGVNNGRKKSLLVSGGCTPEGAVPIGPDLPLLANLKAQYGLRLNFHLGLIDQETMEEVAQIADCASFDLVADDETIRQVFGWQATAAQVVAAYRRLRQRVHTVPHILVGVQCGQLSGERKALEVLAEEPPESLVFIVFVPTRGTRFAARTPPDLREVVGFWCEARQQLPETQLILGCMRPGGSYREELDSWAVRCGLNRIVQPTPHAIQVAKEMGLKEVWGDECCAL